MTKLSEFIPIEYIKKSNKLQELGSILFFGDKEHKEEYLAKYNINYPCEHNICLSIADIIDNAEFLYKERGLMHSNRILKRCFENKSIEEISQYIIDNIKD